MNIIQPLEKGNPTICNNMDGARGHCGAINQTEKDKYCMILLIGRIFKTPNLQIWRRSWSKGRNFQV